MTIGMTCPACGKGGALTIDSRTGIALEGGATVRRRRQCRHCGERWSTYEVPAHTFQQFHELDRMVGQIRLMLERTRKRAISPRLQI